jgi:long-subunit acyl-CoA synthetase (AMP-forming)
VLEFFAALGLPICEVWGMSETSLIATINPQDAIRIGTVGVPLPGVELSLADDGELLVRGPIVMRGYRNDPERTAETIDADGWLHTGDIAEIDADGYVRIVDRKKELIINSAGKNMSPANIENKLKASCPLIGSAIAIGDRRPYNTALIVLDPVAAASFAAAHGLAAATAAELAAEPAIQAEVQAGVERANASLSRVEQIKRHTLLAEEWQPGGEELTPTMKLRRKPIAAKYAAAIDAMYATLAPAPPPARLPGSGKRRRAATRAQPFLGVAAAALGVAGGERGDVGERRDPPEAAPGAVGDLRREHPHAPRVALVRAALGVEHRLGDVVHHRLAPVWRRTGPREPTR